MGSVRFSQAARSLAEEARRRGLSAPSFRSPPRVAGADRTLRRWPGGSCVVAVRMRGRPERDVVVDMVDGVLAANGMTGERADRLRGVLLASVLADEGDHRAA